MDFPAQVIKEVQSKAASILASRPPSTRGSHLEVTARLGPDPRGPRGGAGSPMLQPGGGPSGRPRRPGGGSGVDADFPLSAIGKWVFATEEASVPENPVSD